MNSTLFERIQRATSRYPGELETLTSERLDWLERRGRKGGTRDDGSHIGRYPDSGTGHVHF